MLALRIDSQQSGNRGNERKLAGAQRVGQNANAKAGNNIAHDVNDYDVERNCGRANQGRYAVDEDGVKGRVVDEEK